MKLQFKTLLFLLLIPALVMANVDKDKDKFKGKYTKTKTLNKQYDVNSDASLLVNNSYGNIDIVTWDQNRVMIEVVITTNGNNEEKVQQKLDDIDVRFSGSSSRVEAKTIFDGKKNSSWSWWGGKKNNVNMQIDYTIKLPVTNSVDLSNDYGGINLNRLEGNAVINCDYGQINIGELMAEGNYLNFDYTKNSSIDYMRSGKINADYSSFNLDKVVDLEINADYTKSEIGDAGTIDYNCDYGRLTIDKTGSIVGDGNYIPLRIGELSGDMEVDSDYGSITVERITANGGDIDISSDYAGIKLGFDSGYSFDFDLRLSYASLKGEDDVEVMITDKSGSNKTYKGYHGQKGSGNTIDIDSNYGGVTFSRY